jgi:hypothetical protein
MPPPLSVGETSPTAELSIGIEFPRAFTPAQPPGGLKTLKPASVIDVQGGTPLVWISEFEIVGVPDMWVAVAEFATEIVQLLRVVLPEPSKAA